MLGAFTYLRRLPLLFAMAFLLFAKVAIFDQNRGLRPVPTPPDIDLKKYVSFTADKLKKFSLGFENAEAAFLWIHLLQKANDKPVTEGRISWEYVQTEMITSLDPNFESPYHFASMILPVLRQDKEGTHRILLKWIKKSPTQWLPHYLLAFYLYDVLGDYPKAATQMLKAAELPGAPAHLAALGVRLLSETGALEHTLSTALQFYQVNQGNSERQERLRRRIRSISFVLQKRSWEKALEKFKAANGRAPSDTGEFVSLVDWRPRDLAANEEMFKFLGERFLFRYDSDRRQIESVKSYTELQIDPTLGIFRRK